MAEACSKMILAFSCVFSGVIVPTPIRKNCARAEMGRQRVVQLVRDLGGHFALRREPLGADQLVLGALQRDVLGVRLL